MNAETDNNKRTEKSSSQEGAYLVCQGATCMCDAGAGGPVKLMITSQTKVFINENQLVATIKDANLQVPVAPFGTCKLNPNKQAPLCEYTPTEEWTWASPVGNEHPEVCGLKVLTEKAMLVCPKYKGNLSIFTHGQQIDVIDGQEKEIDSDIAVAITCLFEMPEDQPQQSVIPSVVSVKFEDGTKSNKSPLVELVVRKGQQFDLEAIYSKKTEKASYAYWYIVPASDNEKKSLKFQPEKGIVCKQPGNKITMCLNKEGEYLVEGFGQLTYAGGKRKSTLDKDCVFLFKVFDNKLKGIKLSPSAVEWYSDNELEIWCGQAYTIKIETEFELTEKERETLTVKIEDSDRNILKRYSSVEDNSPYTVNGQNTIKLIPLNEGIYYISVSIFGKPEVRYTLLAIRDKLEKKIITTNLPSSGLVRPGAIIKFEAKQIKLSNTGVLSWFIDGTKLADKHGLSLEYTFYSLTKHKIHASLFQLFGKSGKTDPIIVDVKENSVTSVRSNAGRISLPVGSSVDFTAETVFDNILLSNREGILWRIIPSNTQKRIGGTAPLVIRGSQLDEGKFDERGVLNIGGKNCAQKALTVVFNQVGEYEISAGMKSNVSHPSLKIKIDYAKIEAWRFIDSKGYHRKKIGWGQEFYIYLKVNGWENREISLQLWHDTGRREGDFSSFFKKIDADELKSKRVRVKPDGVCCVKIGSASFWKSFEQVMSSSSRHDTAFFFTAYDVQTLCDNWKLSIYEGLNGHIFPDVTDGTYGYIPRKTAYRGMFANSQGNELKQIISYDDSAKIVAWIDNEMGDSFKDDKYHLYLYENKEKDDVVNAVATLSFNGEGMLEYNLPMGAIKSRKEAYHPDHKPRFFYFILNKVEKGIFYGSNEKQAYIYPEGYGTGKNNDKNLIYFQKDNFDESDLIKEEEAAQKWASTFDFAGLNGADKKITMLSSQYEVWAIQEAEIRKEKEAKERKERVKGRNKVAEEHNNAVLRKNTDYFRQLKIAEKPEHESSLFTRTAKKIGSPLTYEKKSKQGECPRCKAAITKDQLKEIFWYYKHETDLKKGKKTYVDDSILEIVAKTYTDNMTKFGMDTCWNKAHFFAQAAVETGYQMIYEERLTYTKDGILSTFKHIFYKDDKFKAGAKEKVEEIFKIPAGMERQKAIANYVYDDRNGATLGNNKDGDGWKYIGRSSVHLTGKAGYKFANDNYLLKEGYDIINNPQLAAQYDVGTIVSMAFWKWKNLQSISNGEMDVIEKICKSVGGNPKTWTRNFKRSRNHTDKEFEFKEYTSKIFKIDECQWGEQKAFKTSPTYTNEYYIDIESRTVERGKKIPESDDFSIYIIFYKGIEYKKYQLDNSFSPDQILFPASGSGFDRYSVVDIGGDHYLKPLCSAHLFGLITEMYIIEGESFRVDLGDMSNKEGKAPGGDHKMHGGSSGYSGVCIDYRYIGNNKKSYQGKTGNSLFDLELNYRFLKISREWKFTKNYISNIHSWNVSSNDDISKYASKIGGHDDHGHLTFIE